MSLWNQAKTPPEYFEQLFRVSRNQIIFGGNYFIEETNKDSQCWIVWDKLNGENDFADCELAWTSFDMASRVFRFRWAGMLQGDMKNKEKRIHPTQKPVALYRWIFNRFAKEGDRILDTHLGSGSSRIAAYEAKLDFTGYEIDKEYYEAQEKNLNITHLNCLSFREGDKEMKQEEIVKIRITQEVPLGLNPRPERGKVYDAYKGKTQEPLETDVYYVSVDGKLAVVFPEECEVVE